MKFLIKPLFTLTIIVGFAFLPNKTLAKHGCIISAPLENCSHEQAVCTDLMSNQRIGNKNSSVTKLQVYLATYGYLTVAPTGYFGTKTQEAVTNFQKTHNIDGTGFVGPLTRSQLKKNSCFSNTTTPAGQSIIPASPISENSQSASAWNSWTATKLSPLSEVAMNTLKQVLGSVGVNTNFATTTLTEQEIIDMTKKFEREYILNR